MKHFYRGFIILLAIYFIIGLVISCAIFSKFMARNYIGNIGVAIFWSSFFVVGLGAFASWGHDEGPNPPMHPY